jgi:hypothetical protein
MPAVQRQPSPPSPPPLPTPAPAPVPHRQEEDALFTPPWLPPPDSMALEPALEWAAAVAKVVTAAAALLASSPWQPPSLLLSPRGAPSEQPAPNRGSSRGRASATAPNDSTIGLAPADPQTARGLPFPPKPQPKRSDSRNRSYRKGLYGLHFSLALLLLSA